MHAQVAVVTNIGMDHNEFAGPTLADVAREKAGIIEPTSAAVIGETDPAIVAVLAEAPAASRLLRGTDFETAGNTLAVGGRLVDIRTPTTIYPDVFVPLHGAHQGDNASLALTAVEAFFAAPLAEDVVAEGFAAVSVPGRFEVIGYQPLVVVDGAHNPVGADTCAQVFFDDFNPDGRRILVFGTLREPTAMLEALRADEFDLVVACTAPSPRGIPVADVARAAVALGCDEVLAADDVGPGLRYRDARRRRRRRHPRRRQPLRRRRRPPRPPAAAAVAPPAFWGRPLPHVVLGRIPDRIRQPARPDRSPARRCGAQRRTLRRIRSASRAGRVTIARYVNRSTT